MQSTLMLILAAAKLICGGLSDKLGAKTVTVICMACAVIGQFMLSATSDPVLCYIALTALSVGMCMTALMAPLLSAPLFGYRGCLTANSILLAMCSLASIFSSPISNTCYDLTGSYTPAFRIASIVNCVVLGLYLLLFVIANAERKRYFQTHPDEGPPQTGT
jgi:MFS family permease